jgi:hypothetical protein
MPFAEFQPELHALRGVLAGISLDLKLLRLAHFFKGYSADQPRVPAGNPDGGQWTSGGGGDGSSAFEDMVPAGIGDQYAQADLPPPVNGQPPNSTRWTTLARIAAVELAQAIQDGRAEEYIRTLTENAAWATAKINEIYAYMDNPKSLEELNRLADEPTPGYQIHHIVEQGPASKDGYTPAEIETPENLVRVPTLKHYEITAYYATKRDDLGGMSPREYLNEKAWYVRREFGLKVLRQQGVLKW